MRYTNRHFTYYLLTYSRLAQTCFFHLRRLHSVRVRRQLGTDVTKRLVCALVLPRLDYCNVILAGLSFCQNPTIFSLIYGNLTIFKMAAVRLLGFWEHAVFIMWPLSACRYASAYKILTKSDNRSMSRGQKSEFQDVELQKFQFLVTWL